ncbi:MAG: hypothetical protein GXY83_13405 [Rhodopirellula sp.]|nr:hypothetical protein [Rhodopirellula sp.]
MLDTIFLRQVQAAAGLDPWADLPRLKSLGLDDTTVTDARSGEFKHPSNLQFPHLGRIEIADGGLEDFYGLKGLKELNAHQCKGVGRLQNALPSGTIIKTGTFEA